MIPIGQFSELEVLSRDRYGLRLGDAREQVLLPNKFVPEGIQPGERIRVFVYTDSEDTPIATTQIPFAVVGQFACLEVVDLTPQGAFLDWGLDKDLFVPARLQHHPMLIGQKHVVALYLDERTDRVAAAGRIAEYLDYEVSHLEEGAPVELMVYGFNELGAQVIVDERHAGMIYRSEIVTPLTIGSRLRGFIERVRDDNKLDIRLKRPGAEGLADAEIAILGALERAGGYLALHDRSSPDEVRRVLSLSKKNFKAALGTLYRKRRVELLEGGVRLLNKPTSLKSAPSKP